MVVITDVCACEYTDHGHCGIIGDTRYGPDLLNDPSLDLMNKIAISHAENGADIVAPSCMLDGVVGSIRNALDNAGFEEVLIMSYSTKFASALYGPFREAADSGFVFGDRTTYQIHPGNSREAILESQMDADEGADILMVKPAGFYLDILADIATLGLPVAAYQVSGEYSMIKCAAERGWIKEKETVFEILTSIKRAGAELIITYYASDVARWLDEEQ
jgi:porphobilinogen synthase